MQCFVDINSILKDSEVGEITIVWYKSGRDKWVEAEAGSDYAHFIKFMSSVWTRIHFPADDCWLSFLNFE